MSRIPKIIHYCWFGKGEYPPVAEQCLESWKKYLPDFTIKKWDESNAPIDIPFAGEAFRAEKWAFVSDYVRLRALIEEGGIYLDTDMLLIKGLDEFLDNACFLGAEDPQTINASIIGAIPGHWFIEECLNLYRQKIYDPQLPMLIPRVCTRLLKEHGPIQVNGITRIRDITLYPPVYFYPMPFDQARRPNDYKDWVKSETAAIHLWHTSWHSEWQLIAAGDFREGRRRIVERIRSGPGPRYYLKAAFYLSGAYHLRERWRQSRLSFLKALLRITPVRRILLPVLSYDLKWQALPPETSFPEQNWREISRRGLTFRVNPGEHNGWRIFFDLFPESTYRFFERIGPEAVVFDIGANIGFFTLHFARKATRGKVIAFEPFPANFNLLKYHIEKNGFSNVQPIRAALGDHKGTVKLSDPEERNKGMVRIDTETDPGQAGIPLLTLDEFVREEDIRRVDVIKVDIEGYEMNFLKGARKTISRHKPILFMELADKHLRNFGSSAEEVVAFLESLDYAVIRADTGKTIRSKHFLSDCFFDIIATPSLSERDQHQNRQK